MDRKRIYFLTLSLLLLFLWILPITFADNEEVYPNEALSIPLTSGNPPDLEFCKGVRGSFSSDVELTVFISNSSGFSYWGNYKQIPPYALWSTKGVSGSYDVMFPEENITTAYIILFHNNESTTAHITFTADCLGLNGGGIPSFEYFFIFYALICSIAIFLIRKK